VALLLWQAPARADSTAIATIGEANQESDSRVQGSASDSLPQTAYLPPAPAGATWDSLGVGSGTVPELSYWSLIAKLGMGLALVGLLVWGLVLLLRRTGLGQQLTSGGGTVRVAERAFLGPKKAIYLVEIGDRVLALGITEQSISVLAEWRSGELDLPPRSAATGPLGAPFRSLLGQFRKGAPAPEEQR
jgi:flagellar protein FliO/FliZ